ncbi:MAG TPA: dienelactone hydrolase family protein [Acidimicrobiia bacterium]
MAEVLLFHHALGLTDGVETFADRLRSAGHRVTTPDLYEGATFRTVEQGVAHAEAVGFDEILAAGTGAAGQSPAGAVYAGLSLGALVAHMLAQTRPGAAGALLYHHGDVPVTTFGPSWPSRVDLQIHVNEHDPWCELDVVEEFVAVAGAHARAELFVYPGSTHLFLDSGLDDFDPASANLALERTLAFLNRIG